MSEINTPAVAMPDPATGKRWRVLIIDDCIDDADLAEIELRGGGIDAEFLRVDNERALREALATFAPDLVLSDVNLPGFSGVRAHAIVHELRPDSRFVFLTGSVEGSIEFPPAVAVINKNRLPDLSTLIHQLLVM